MSQSKRARLVGLAQNNNGNDGTSDDGGNNVEAEPNYPVLGLSLILRKILSNLGVGDLLQCSLINKQWNYEARCVLRDLKQTYVRIYTPSACTDLKKLNDDLADMSVIPINALKFNGYMGNHIENNTCVGQKITEEYFPTLFQRMPLKYLTLTLTGENNEDCPTMDFISKILHHKSNSLEELTLAAVPKGFEWELEGLLLPNLKILDVSNLVKHGSRQLITALLNAAPNLVQLCMDVSQDGLELIPCNKLHTIKRFLIPYYHNYYSEEQLSRFFLTGPKLDQLHVHAPSVSPEATPEVLWNGLKTIFQSSRESLKELSIDPIASNKLLHWDVGPFDNLDTMYLVVDFQDRREVFRQSLMKINFTKLFPNLTSIHIHEIILGRWEVEQYLEFTEQLIPDAAAGSSDLITELIVIGQMDRFKINFFKACFPHVTKVDYRRLTDSPWPYGLIFDCYAGLERVVIDECGLTHDMNYDAEFCGLHPEEVKELWDKDEEFLRNLNIVATAPGVSHMQNLKELCINVCGFGDYREVKGHGKLFLSKVTGILAFNRMPSVTVSIVLDSHIPDFNHLDAYCTIEVED